MTARKRLDEMKRFIKIAEAAWDLPRSKEDFDKLAAALNSKEPNVKIQDMLYNVLGDDDLFDRLDKLDLHGYDAPATIIQWMKDQRKDPHSNFPNIWNTYKLSQRHDSPMNEEDFGPATQGKSDIIKKWGAEQSKEVTDLSLSGDDDECPNRCVDGVFPAPDYEGLEACRACDKFDKRYPKKGLDEDTYPETEATVAMYAKHDTDDFQNRGDNYPSSGIPVRIDAHSFSNVARLSFMFKNTSTDDARAFVSQFMQQHGLPFSDIEAWQSGDFQDDWVTTEATYTVSKELDEDPEDFKNTLVNPQWDERRTAEIQKRKDWLRRTYQSGETIPDDLHMARVKTPKGTGTVYSIYNYETMEGHDAPTVSVRLDNDPGGYGGGQLQYIFKIDDVEILPDELDEVGDVKFDDYGAVDEDGRPGFQYDSDPDGMGRYEVVIRSSEGEDYQTGDSIPYDQAEILAKETIDNIVKNIPGDSIVTKKYKGDSVWFKIIEPAYEMTTYVVIEPDEMYESISLDNIVEGVLQEYPGQKIDLEYEADEDERFKDDYADQMNDIAGDYGNEISSEIEDDELGYRFD